MFFSTLVNNCIKAIIVFFPWRIKRPLLKFKYDLAASAHIGFSWIYPSKLRMGSGSRIDSFNVALNLDFIELSDYSIISRNNWITGFPSRTRSLHFSHQPNRSSVLRLGEHAAITKNHHIDATNQISIGAFSTIAGYNSQLLTHSIDLLQNRQHSEPIVIGSHCFVGTNCIILGGSILPDYSILGALSLLNNSFTETWSLYAGQPARRVKPVERTAAYFNRTLGYVT
jgi:acetyltransferase-like isoleucine patch superfamily enzyme